MHAQHNGDTAEDSPWADDPLDHSSTRAISETEYERMRTRCFDEGYREGITAGKTDLIQTGFDQGYKAAVDGARRLGMARGLANALLQTFLMRQKNKTSATLQDAQDLEAARQIILSLSRLTIDDVCAKDLEAEQHFQQEHDGVLPASEDSVDNLLNNTTFGLGTQSEHWSLERCQRHLEEIADRLKADATQKT